MSTSSATMIEALSLVTTGSEPTRRNGGIQIPLTEAARESLRTGGHNNTASSSSTSVLLASPSMIPLTKLTPLTTRKTQKKEKTTLKEGAGEKDVSEKDSRGAPIMDKTTNPSNEVIDVDATSTNKISEEDEIKAKRESHLQEEEASGADEQTENEDDEEWMTMLPPPRPLISYEDNEEGDDEDEDDDGVFDDVSEDEGDDLYPDASSRPVLKIQVEPLFGYVPTSQVEYNIVCQQVMNALLVQDDDDDDNDTSKEQQDASIEDPLAWHLEERSAELLQHGVAEFVVVHEAYSSPSSSSENEAAPTDGATDDNDKSNPITTTTTATASNSESAIDHDWTTVTVQYPAHLILPVSLDSSSDSNVMVVSTQRQWNRLVAQAMRPDEAAAGGGGGLVKPILFRYLLQCQRSLGWKIQLGHELERLVEYEEEQRLLRQYENDLETWRTTGRSSKLEQLYEIRDLIQSKVQHTLDRLSELQQQQYEELREIQQKQQPAATSRSNKTTKVEAVNIDEGDADDDGDDAWRDNHDTNIRLQLSTEEAAASGLGGLLDDDERLLQDCATTPKLVKMEAVLDSLQQRLDQVDDLLEQLQDEEWADAEGDNDDDDDDDGFGRDLDDDDPWSALTSAASPYAIADPVRDSKTKKKKDKSNNSKKEKSKSKDIPTSQPINASTSTSDTESSSSFSLLDQILAMILGSLRWTDTNSSTEEEHYQFIRQEHEYIKETWMNQFGRLPIHAAPPRRKRRKKKAKKLRENHDPITLGKKRDNDHEEKQEQTSSSSAQLFDDALEERHKNTIDEFVLTSEMREAAANLRSNLGIAENDDGDWDDD